MLSPTASGLLHRSLFPGRGRSRTTRSDVTIAKGLHNRHETDGTLLPVILTQALRSGKISIARTPVPA